MQSPVRLVATFGFEFRRVGIGLINITGLHRQKIFLRRLTESQLHFLDEIHQFHRVAATDVIHLERHARSAILGLRLVVDGANRSLGNVVDVSEVANHIAVVENLDRLALADGSCEEHRRHIGPSPRAVNREKSQAGGRKTVEFAVGVSHQFVAHFRCGIKAHGLRDFVVLAVRNLRIHAVNRTRRGVNQMLDAVVPARFEHVQKAHDVALQVGVRVRDAVAHAGLRRHIHDLLELFAFHQAVERGFVVDGHPDETAIGQRRAPNFTPPLDFRRVGSDAALAKPTVLQSRVVIVVDVVDSDDFIASLGQFPHQSRADETGCSSY